ncbi:MAG: tRNA pseudouridine(38-40) synthase TruA [Chloroflexi bacterium]|nr:tRNA pseudouridine(38-40) synthase TruA [Chloroflexota bacterium]
MRRIALVVEYEGTRYQGFQVQKHAPTIQGELEKALQQLTGERRRVAGASRTDAGVHAQGQVASFLTASRYAPEVYERALTHYLPEDIAVRAAYEVRSSFDVRREALARQYCYLILNRPSASPLWRRFAHRVAGPLDTAAMDAASRLFVGERDFASFAGALEPGSRSTVRRIVRARVSRKGERVMFTIQANAFLPQQVRRMAGALVAVGAGKMDIAALRRMLGAPEKGVARPVLPACGLYLVRVIYRDFPPENRE